MASSLYLSADLKKYYTRCLQTALDNGEIDEGLREYLLHINSNENIQTIFSKRYQGEETSAAESYLHIAYVIEIENILLNALDQFHAEIWQTFFKRVEIAPTPPRLQLGKVHATSCWQRDEAYFNINYFTVEFISIDMFQHEFFWRKLSGRLALIKPAVK